MKPERQSDLMAAVALAIVVVAMLNVAAGFDSQETSCCP
jgi:hypothetical protein